MPQKDKVQRQIFVVNDIASVDIAKARGYKCERCWHYEVVMSKNLKHPNICNRCEKVVFEYN